MNEPRRTRRIRKGHQGFTLIESMIAVALIAVALMSIAQLMGFAVQQTSMGRFKTMALGLANEKLEDLRQEFVNELENGTVSSDLTAGNHTGPNRTLTAPTGSNMEDVTFQTSWSVVVAGQRKTVTITVQPATQSRSTSGALALTTVLAP